MAEPPTHEEGDGQSIVRIAGLGHAGDGLSESGLFVPMTVPGDLVRIQENGKHISVLEILERGSSRAEPRCPHFGFCGGCALQHMDDLSYRAWKESLLSITLKQRGIDVPIEPMRFVGPSTRRRASFKARRTGQTIQIGFYEAGTHTLVDVEACAVLAPPLLTLMKRLRTELIKVLHKDEGAEILATLTDTGIDANLILKRPRSLNLVTQLSSLAQNTKLSRLSWNGELIAMQEQPTLQIGKAAVNLPIAPFLQPSLEGEHILQALVTENVGGAKRVADLFCGCGTFALSVAPKRQVHAVDSGEAMVGALKDAARRGQAAVTTETRDLFRRPLSAPELKAYDAVILDPPRQGASAQADALAASTVKRIAYVSCSPASFARDARILIDGGYRLTRVTPLDQFLWSPHVELAALFQRPE